jgi:hypothetical protein
MPVRIDTIAVTIAPPPTDRPSAWRLRQVNVQVGLLVEVRLDAERLRAVRTTDSAARSTRSSRRRACRSRRLALARQRDRFDRQEVAADFGPRESGDLADLVLLLGDAVREAAHAEILVEILA